MKPMVRVSILRYPPERFAELWQMAAEAGGATSSKRLPG